MNKRTKESLLTLPIIFFGGIVLYIPLKFRQVLGADLSTILFFLGAIILSIGLAALDIKYNRKVDLKNSTEQTGK
jgi:hypothetical protein